MSKKKIYLRIIISLVIAILIVTGMHFFPIKNNGSCWGSARECSPTDSINPGGPLNFDCKKYTDDISFCVEEVYGYPFTLLIRRYHMVTFDEISKEKTDDYFLHLVVNILIYTILLYIIFSLVSLITSKIPRYIKKIIIWIIVLIILAGLIWFFYPKSYLGNCGCYGFRIENEFICFGKLSCR